jgi:hypothetical protein
MPYPPLRLPETKASAAISIATEAHLSQAHYLLAATYPQAGPYAHFGTSAAIMTLLGIAAASAIRYFDPKRNKKPSGIDRKAFVGCVEQYFPWDQVTIDDDQHRPTGDRPKLAAAELYDVFRNPLVHSGGVTAAPHLSGAIGAWFRAPTIAHVFPGLGTTHENEMAIAKYCETELNDDVLLSLEATRSIVFTRPLYWCARRMIERLAYDPAVQREVAQALDV